MNSPRTRKLLRWSLGLLLGLVTLLVAAVFIAQRYIDAPSVRADLSKKLSQAVNGQVTWDDLEIRLLPLPHGVVKGAHLTIPNTVKVDVATTEVTLRLLPLFRGHAELKAITVLQPSVDVWIAKSEGKDKPANTDNVLALYRNAMRPTVDIVARFAPDTRLAIKQGRVALHVLDLPPFEASALDLAIVTDGAGATVNASAQGTYWDSVTLDGRVEFDDLRAVAKLDTVGLKPQPVLEGLFTNIREALVLSSVGAQLEARTDGNTTIDIALDLDLPKAALQRRGKQLDIVEIKLVGAMKFSGHDVEIALDKIRLGDLAPNAQASLRLTGPTREPSISIGIELLELTRLHDAAVTLANDQPFVRNTIARLRSGRLLNLQLETQAATFAELFSLAQLRGHVSVVDGGMLVPAIERNAKQVAAQVELIDGTLKIKEVSGRIGASLLRQGSTDIVLTKPMRLANTQAQATIVLDDLLPRLRARPEFAKALQSVPELTGTADVSVRNVALRFDRPAQTTYDLTVRPRRVRVHSEQLPAPLAVHGGSARITPSAIALERVGVELFASKARISGEVTEFRNKQPRVVARVADGVADKSLIDWLWQRAAIAERFKPATPIQLQAQRVQWSAAGLEIVANAKLATGSSLDVDLLVRDKEFALRRGAFKDRDSDALFSYARRGSFIDVGFAGAFSGRSLTTIFSRPAEQYAGHMTGDLQLTLDLERHRRSTVRGKLIGEQIDLNNIVAMPIKVEHLDVQGDGDALHIRELSVDWAKQKATLRGDIARQANGLAITIDVTTPSFVIDALRAPATDATPAANAAKARPTAKPAKVAAPFDPWTLPLTGTVALRADSLEYQQRRLEGVRALIDIEPKRATLNVTEASLCGMRIPFTFHASPKEFSARANVSAQNLSLGSVTHCLGSEQVSLSGNFDIVGAVATQGHADNLSESLIQNLTGAVDFRAKDGEIRKMALLGNILSLKSVSDLLKGDVKLKEAGFKYRDITVRSKVNAGKITLEQASLDSAALGIATTGTINIEDYESRLTVLVAPFGRLDRVMRKVPIVGYIMGGAMTSIPVGVSGDIRNPTVVPLGPGAVGSELLGIFERTFKLPGKIVEPLTTTPK